MTESDWHKMQDDLEAGELCLGNLEAILDNYGACTVSELGRCIYKYTDCGAHLSVLLHDGTWRHSGNLNGIENGNVRALQVGSIVEGSDATVTGDYIDLLTFDDMEECVKRFNAEVSYVNDEACSLWDEAHASDDDDLLVE